MSNRKIPPEIMAYLGTCRPTRGLVEKVIEQIGLGKFMKDAGLTDYDPLVVIMHLVTEEILDRDKSFEDPKIRKAWLWIVQRIQDGEAGTEHNPMIPCRSCDQAFLPEIDEILLTLFLAWHWRRRSTELLAIHRCPACGGQLKAKRTETYQGDMHTPPPGSVADDEQWVAELLQHSSI